MAAPVTLRAAASGRKAMARSYRERQLKTLKA